MFGLVSGRLGGKKKKPKAPRKKKRKKKDSGFRFWSMLRTKGFLRRLTLLVRDIFSCIRLRKFKLWLRLGLDDPADTGYVFGGVYAVRSFIPAECSVTIEPEFTEPVLEGYSRGTVTCTPICLVWSLVKFVFSKASLKVLWGIVTGKWKKKK